MLVAAAVCAPASIDAQWVKHRTPGILRGRPMEGRTWRRCTADRRRQTRLLREWITAPANALPCGRGLVEYGIELPMSREGGYMGARFRPVFRTSPGRRNSSRRTWRRALLPGRSAWSVPAGYVLARVRPAAHRQVHSDVAAPDRAQGTSSITVQIFLRRSCAPGRSDPLVEGVLLVAGRVTRSSSTPLAFATICGSIFAVARWLECRQGSRADHSSGL